MRSTNNLLEALRRSVDARGGETALAHREGGGWREITYTELWHRVRNCAAGLHVLGVQEGSTVALISGNRPEWPIVDFATQSLGAMTVPVYPTLEAEQMSHILADSGAVVVVVEDAKNVEKVVAAREALPNLRNVVIVGEGGNGRPQKGDIEASLPGLPHATANGEEEAEEAEEAEEGMVLRFSEVESRGAAPFESWEDGWRALGRDDVATIIYTSGTTGMPKGVVLSHGNILSVVEAVVRALPLGAEDVFLSFLPLSHVFERTSGQFVALYLGAATYYAESVEKVPDNLREVRPTVMPSVPRLYEKMYDGVRRRVAEGPALRRRLFEAAIAAGRRKYGLERAGRPLPRGLKARLAVYDRLVFKKLREAIGGRLRFFVSGGAKLDKEIGEFFYAAGIRILEGYGLTETSPSISCNLFPVPRFGTVGPPLDNVEVRISAEGEVQVLGPNVTRGYWKNDAATREAFTEDGWFRTGDIGELDNEGYLIITDRLKSIIVLSTGKNVVPAPVEAAIASSPLVSQAILFGDGEKYVIALVAPDYDAVRVAMETGAENEQLAEDPLCEKLIEDEVTRACARFVPHERPKKVRLLSRELTHEADELTPTLKVKLRVVKERYAKEVESLYVRDPA